MLAPLVEIRSKLQDPPPAWLSQGVALRKINPHWLGFSVMAQGQLWVFLQNHLKSDFGGLHGNSSVALWRACRIAAAWL